VAGASTALKWPNDVLVEQDAGEWRKIAGILASVVGTPDGPGVVVGMGVNVLQRVDELPVDTAASLATVAATTTDLDTVVRAVLRELGDQLERWLQHRGDPTSSGVAAAYLAACRTVGRDIQVHLPDSTVLAAERERRRRRPARRPAT
jgi:BirA family biotin operon repressor/biotin-[acetyl-CoA-carboxylase] ligase